MYCEDCDKYVDTDYNAEHFDEPKECVEEIPQSKPTNMTQMKEVSIKVAETITHSVIWAVVVIFSVTVLASLMHYTSDEELRVEQQEYNNQFTTREWAQNTLLMQLRGEINDCEKSASVSLRTETIVPDDATLVEDFYVRCND